MTIRDRMIETVQWLSQRRLVGVAILALGGLLATLVIATGPTAEPRLPEEKAWPVSVTRAEPAPRSPSIVAFGRVESRQVANLKTSVSTVVAEVLTPEGSEVRAGELMVRMETDELALAVRRAEAEHKRRIAELTAVRSDFESARRMTEHHRELLDIAESKLARHRELFASGMISEVIFDEIRQQASERAITLETHLSTINKFPSLVDQHEAMTAEAAAALEVARLDLEQTEIRAPFDGRVIEADVAPGDRILPGTVIARVANHDDVEVRASMPANAGPTLRQQLDAGKHVRARGTVDGRTIELRLARLSGSVRPGQSGLDAFFTPANDLSLDIGRVLDLTVTLPPIDNVVAVPLQSLYGNERIYRVVDSRLERISAVKVGDFIDEDGGFKVLVRAEGLGEGDRIVTTQLPRAINGLLVEAVEDVDFDGAIAAKPGGAGVGG